MVPFILTAAGAAAWMVTTDSGQPEVGPENGSGLQALPTQESPPVPDPDPPPGLEGAAAELHAAVLDGVEEEVGSLLQEQGVENGPPSEWLSGAYLASADDFSHVRGFWVRYGEVIQELRVGGRGLVESHLEEVLDRAELPEAERGRVASYLQERLQRDSAVSEARLQVLQEVARGAVEFHDLLSTHQEGIQHQPAVGGALSSDPVLEVRIPDPGVEREVTVHLDRVLMALRALSPGEPLNRPRLLSLLSQGLVLPAQAAAGG